MREGRSQPIARSPPLNAVRVFAVAARHASFTLAASELGVTHGAVSRQVKHLEEHLGTPLFVRGVRRVSLTPAGRELFAGVAPALERIAATAEAVAVAAPARSLRINVRPSFAVRWMIPNLARFLAVHPGIVPQLVTTTTDPCRIGRDGFDVALRRGRSAWPAGVRVRPFLSEWGVPVASPELLAKRPLGSADDLRQHTLLRCATRDGDWPAWLEQVGAGEVRPAGELVFQHLEFTLQAAVDGLGIALGPSAHVAEDIAAGRLVTPLLGPRIELTSYFYGVRGGDNAAAHDFIAWLDALYEAENDRPGRLHATLS